MKDRRYFTPLPFWVALIVCSATPALAQSPADSPHEVRSAQHFTLEDLFASPRFVGRNFQGGRWADEGPVITFIEGDAAERRAHLIEYNLETDTRRRLIDGNRLFAEDVNRHIIIEDYLYSNDWRQMLLYTDSEPVWRLNTKGYYYVYNVESSALTPLSDRGKGFQMFAKFSPDERHVAFVRARNIFVTDLITMEERQLTEDGSDGGIINGTFDWVYEEEFYLRDGWSWNPDGGQIAFFKLDESQVPEYVLADQRSLYPEVFEYRYPKAGEKNSEIQIGILDVESGEQSFFDTQTWHANDNQFEYLARMGWTPLVDGKRYVWMFRLNRDQNLLQLLYGDPETMQVQVVLEEREETWIDVYDGKLTYLNDNLHFIWISEVDGYNHLYLYRNDGEFVRQITDGPWEVTEFNGVDEEAGFAYFTATLQSPLERHLYRTELYADNGGAAGPDKITGESGWHNIQLSGDAGFYIDTYSNITTPPITRLHSIDGGLINVLEGNDALILTLSQYTMEEPIFVTVSSAGEDQLAAALILPVDFDSTRAHPMLLHQYAGPGSQVVRDMWGGTRYLWHQKLANQYGIIVALVDNRGTGGRGKAFKSTTYRQLGLVESDDLIAAARDLAELAYIDESRMAIWGWSYGGYTTLLSMMRGSGPETFKLGISVAPVSDWRLYDTIYTERYMSTPQRNPEGYESTSALNYADRLGDDQRLLIAHGDYDDNVHFQHVAFMADALQNANKQFSLMVYPGRNHALIGGLTRLHLHTMMTNFIVDNL